MDTQDSDASFARSTSSSISNLSPFAAPFLPRDMSAFFPSMPVATPATSGLGLEWCPPGDLSLKHGPGLHLSASSLSSLGVDNERHHGGLRHCRSFPTSLENVFDGGGCVESRLDTPLHALPVGNEVHVLHAASRPSAATKGSSKGDGAVVRILQRTVEEFGDLRSLSEKGRCGSSDSCRQVDTTKESSYLLMLSECLNALQESDDRNIPIGFERDQKRRKASLSSVLLSSEQRLRSFSDSSGASSADCSDQKSTCREKEYDIFDGLSLWNVSEDKFTLSADGGSKSKFLKLMQAPGSTTDTLVSTRSLSCAEEASSSSGQNRPRLFRTASAPVSDWSFGVKWAEEDASLPFWQSSFENVDDVFLEAGETQGLEGEGDDHSEGEITLLADPLRDVNGNVLDEEQLREVLSRKNDSLDINGNLLGEMIAKPSLAAGEAKWSWNDHAVKVSAFERMKLRSDDSGVASLSDHALPLPTICLPPLVQSAADSQASLSCCRPDTQRLCPEHGSEPLTLYCTDCCQTLCALCFSNEHVACRRVLSTSLACRDLRWQLLKLQSSIGSGISCLENRVQQLKPIVAEAVNQKEETKKQMEEHLQKTLEEVRNRHEDLLREVDEMFASKEKQSVDRVYKTEKALLLLQYVSQFLEVLRQRDSGWELLITFDRRLHQLLQKVLHRALIYVEWAPFSLEDDGGDLPASLISCKKTALSLALSVLESDGSSGTASEASYPHCRASLLFRESLYSAEWGSTWAPADAAAGQVVDDDGGWGGFSNASSVQSGKSRTCNSVEAVVKEPNWKLHSTSSVTTMLPKLTGEVENEQEQDRDQDAEDEDVLIREILRYMQRFPPPSSAAASSLPASRAPSLYSEILGTPGLRLSSSDLADDVFTFDEDLVLPGGQQAPAGDRPADIFSRQTSESVAEYRLQQRLALQFPEDHETSFITDLHVTETGRLLFLDAANHCLKRVDLRQPPMCPPARVQIQHPLALCSAGWERVMVSCAGRTLGLYGVGGLGPLRLLATRATRQQYRGLVRASDALVAAASPETRSVDLLDLGGRVLRSVMPVDFVRGPEVVGRNHNGDLLVVHHPANPPTVLICFDMGGHVIWEHEMRTRSRHVSCSKVVGGEDGCVYYALQGDSAIYRLDPATGSDSVLLSSRSGIKFPSSLAVDSRGRVIVTRNELPSCSVISATQLILPTTSEVDIFIHRDAVVTG